MNNEPNTQPCQTKISPFTRFQIFWEGGEGGRGYSIVRLGTGGGGGGGGGTGTPIHTIAPQYVIVIFHGGNCGSAFGRNRLITGRLRVYFATMYKLNRV